MKIAPVLRAFENARPKISSVLLHTGQHYDAAMKAAFFEQLHIPEPDIDLEVGSGTHAVQTAEVMLRFEPVLEEISPAVVLVVGDVNSTLACALVAAKVGIPVFHVEAGLRSFDRAMPEEINRVLTDQISELLFTTERSAESNLVNEGIDKPRIRFVGNVMIDCLRQHVEQSTAPKLTLSKVAGGNRLLSSASGFGLLTLHRPSNVDDRHTLEGLLAKLREISERLPFLFPLHPRTESRISSAGLESILDTPNIVRLPPLGYLEMLGLMREARLVMTDSGGIQEETTALGVPCLTIRENTERPITIEQGTNTLVGADPGAISKAVDDVLTSGGKAGRVPELWDGQAAERIAEEVQSWLKQNAPKRHPG
jgi:UDP-N-acetylglucosamine 2-epimerase (non-hydrolysing)